MNLLVGARQEVRDYVRTLPVRMSLLEVEAGVFLVAFGGEANIVKLHFVGAAGNGRLRQGNVVILNCRIAGVCPHQLAVFTPGLSGGTRFYRQLRMMR